MLSTHLILPAALWPGVRSASNRNEYQRLILKKFWGVERGQCVTLTTSPPSVSRVINYKCLVSVSSVPEGHTTQ
jgi:hypothetical protein